MFKLLFLLLLAYLVYFLIRGYRLVKSMQEGSFIRQNREEEPVEKDISDEAKVIEVKPIRKDDEA